MDDLDALGQAAAIASGAVSPANCLRVPSRGLSPPTRR